jgi:uncharacterized membrane protein YqhA
MQEWLGEKAARESRWVRVGVIASVIAAVLVFVAAVLAFVAWRFPIQ